MRFNTADSHITSLGRRWWQIHSATSRLGWCCRNVDGRLLRLIRLMNGSSARQFHGYIMDRGWRTGWQWRWRWCWRKRMLGGLVVVERCECECVLISVVRMESLQNGRELAIGGFRSDAEVELEGVQGLWLVGVEGQRSGKWALEVGSCGWNMGGQCGVGVGFVLGFKIELNYFSIQIFTGITVW